MVATQEILRRSAWQQLRLGFDTGTMRIACLQFDPKVGEVDNNLNRADAVLGKVHPDLLDGLDLLVLPELAFTGMYSPG